MEERAMANNLYIAATEARSGKSAISLGILEMLISKIDRVAFFRPIIDVNEKNPEYKDNDIHLISSHFNLSTPYESMYAYTANQAKRLLSLGKQTELFAGILTKYNAVAQNYDFVLCEGHEFEGPSASFDFEINAGICNNLACPLLLVANAHHHEVEEVVNAISVYHKSLLRYRCEIVATVVNRLDPEKTKAIIGLLKKEKFQNNEYIYIVPDEKSLGNPTVGEIVQLLDAEVIYGQERLDRHVSSFAVAAMELRNLLTRLKDGMLIVTPGDRADVIMGCLAAVSSHTMPTISGIVLTGGLKPEESVRNLIEGFGIPIPVIGVRTDTFETARRLDTVHTVIAPENERKVIQAIAHFEKNIHTQKLAKRIIQTKTSIVTPQMFEYQLLTKARSHKQHIVLPEGEDERILRATEMLRCRDIVNITLLGKEERIREKITEYGLQLEDITIIEPASSPMFEEYIEQYYELRKHKGITLDIARDTIDDWNFFGSMMVYRGDADGMVSGAIHTTGDTIRPAFQFIKTKKDCLIVSSVFLMCLRDRVLVYGDCAVNPNPNAEELADIALNSAQTAKTFGIEARVAMLSYSTGQSGKGSDVDLVREATTRAQDLAAQRYPEILIEGPIQYDAAISPSVAKAKMPDSAVAGKATIFIFPDLNTGNNTYKAVQRSSGAIAIGPVLQGLRKPVNDLSRGCLVSDIVNTIAITAIQAQNEKED